MKLKEKLSYVKGILDGVSLDNNESIVYSAIVDLLDDVINEMENLDKDISIICDELDAIDEDLDAIEYELDCFEKCSDDEVDCDDQMCSHDDNTIYDITCPRCEEEICIDDSILDMGSIDCPNCGENLTFDFDLDDELDKVEDTNME